MNMDYCKFENTYRDLRACYNALDDEDLSEREKQFKEKLIDLCQSIVDEAVW